jgi:pimeloyl-ACP methyl ester carboxylesterase
VSTSRRTRRRQAAATSRHAGDDREHAGPVAGSAVWPSTRFGGSAAPDPIGTSADRPRCPTHHTGAGVCAPHTGQWGHVAASDPPMPELPGVTHHRIDIGELTVHVAEAGRGRPLVLLHGWPQHWYCWRRVIPLLDDHRLIIPDLRGHGWSDAPRGSYAKEQLVTDVLALLDAMELPTVGLIGHDWGGWVGFLTALRAPERIEALLALGIIHPFQRMTVPKLAQAWRGAYQVGLSLPVAPRVALSTNPLIVRTAVRSATFRREALADDASGVYAASMRNPARARASVQMYRTFLLHELPRLGRYQRERLEPPTRLLIGRRDPIYSRALMDGWQDHARDMTVDVIPDAGHFLPEEAPAEVAVAARALFDSVKRR